MGDRNPYRGEVHPSEGVRDVGSVVRYGIVKRITSRRMKKVKARRKIFCISLRVMDPTLCFSP